MPWIRRYKCMCAVIAANIFDFRYGFLNSEASIQAREFCATPSELLNAATRHKEAPGDQKITLCCLTFCGAWGPPFVWVPVRPNMPKSASVFIVILCWFWRNKWMTDWLCCKGYWLLKRLDLAMNDRASAMTCSCERRLRAASDTGTSSRISDTCSFIASRRCFDAPFVDLPPKTNHKISLYL